MTKRYSLRTLLLFVAILAIPLGWLGWQAKIVRERRATIDEIVAAGGQVTRKADLKYMGGQSQVVEVQPPPWYRGMFGDEAIAIIQLTSRNTSGVAEIEGLFPESLVYNLGY